MHEKQELIGQKRLGQLDNSFKDQLYIANRTLNMKQPFFALPGKIPDSELPMEIEDFFEQMNAAQEAEREQRAREKEQRKAARREKRTN